MTNQPTQPLPEYEWHNRHFTVELLDASGNPLAPAVRFTTNDYITDGGTHWIYLGEKVIEDAEKALRQLFEVAFKNEQAILRVKLACHDCDVDKTLLQKQVGKEAMQKEVEAICERLGASNMLPVEAGYFAFANAVAKSLMTDLCPWE